MGRGFVDDEEVFCGTDRVSFEAGRSGSSDTGVDPEGGDHRTDILQLRDENTWLKQFVAELTLDKTMFQDVLRKML